jgi:nucleoside-diphosphate-sugar epimerase
LLDADASSDLIARLRPDCLLHLAWVTTPGAFWTSPDNELWVRASMALAEAFCDAGGRRIVVAGTCAEYQSQDGVCREGETPLVPISVYGKAKLDLFRRLTRLCNDRAVGFCCGRLFQSYGPHEYASRLIPSVIVSLLGGEEARTTEGRQVRDFLHVSDVATGFVQLVEGEASGAFNICSQEAIRVADVILMIADMLGARDHVRFGALPLAANDPRKLVGDSSRMRALGWRPNVALDAGLASTIDWWRERQLTRAGAAE